MRLWVLSAICSLAAVGAMPAAAHASYAATLDPSFGDHGEQKIAPPAPSSSASADAIALQPDGKILVAGPSSTGVVVARLTADGKPDATFGASGVVALTDVSPLAPSTVPDDNDPARAALRVLPDGRILVLGSELVRLGPDGTRDPSFGSGGTGALPAGFTPAALALDPSGDIVVAGTRSVGGRTPAAVVRLTLDGASEPAFGDSGTATLPEASTAQDQPVDPVSARGVGVAPDGKILVAEIGRIQGQAQSVTYNMRIVARLTGGGELDTTFGSGGQSVGYFTALEPRSLLVRPDGSALFAAENCGWHVGCGPAVVAIGAQTMSRSPDIVVYGPGAGSIAAVRDGRVLWAAPGGRLQDFDAELRPDPNFGVDDSSVDDPSLAARGTAVVDLGSDASTDGAAVVQPGGKLLIAGRSGSAMLVARVFGLSPKPAPRVSIPPARIVATQNGIGLPLGCRVYTSCFGEATLRSRGSVIARGRFAVAGGHRAEVVMQLSARGRRQLLGRRDTPATLQAAADHGNTATRAVTVPPLVATRPARRGRFGPLRPVVSAASSFDSDGHRYVVFTQGTRVTVLDTATQRRWSQTVPAGCPAVRLTRAQLSFPMVIYDCDGVVALNVVTGRFFDVPGAPEDAQIGRHWIGPIPEGCDVPCEQFFNWHTQKVRHVRGAERDGVFEGIPTRDLDSPRLSPVKPCPPGLPAQALDSGAAIPPGSYERPFMLVGDAVGKNPYHSQRGLHLTRCGSATDITLSRTATDPGNAVRDQLGAGFVTWFDPGSTTGFLYDLARGRRLSWTAPLAIRAFATPTAIVHTSDAVIVGVASHQLCVISNCSTSDWTLYEARIRR